MDNNSINKLQFGGYFNLIGYIKELENPNRVGWNGKIWTAPTLKGYDKNLRGYGIDINTNKAARKLTEGRPGRWLTEDEADTLMKNHLDYVRLAAEKHIPNFSNLSQARLGALLGMLYRGDSVNNSGINIMEPDDKKFFKAVSDYYRTKGLNTRADSSDKFLNSPLIQILSLFKKKDGGKMNTLEFLKNGSGIHIKKENKGKFTDYCGGKVTSECIAKGKRSPNAAIRKRATFASNARKWKHLKGGIIKAADGTKTGWFKNTVNKVGNFLSSDLGKTLTNGALSLLSASSSNEQVLALADNQKAQNELTWELMKLQIIKDFLNKRNQNYMLWVSDYQSGKTLDNPSEIVANHFGQEELNSLLAAGKQNLKNLNALIDALAASFKTDILGTAFGNLIQGGLGLLLNKNSNTSSDNSNTGGGWTTNYNSRYGSKDKYTSFFQKPNLDSNISGIKSNNYYNWNTGTFNAPKLLGSFNIPPLKMPV